MTVYNDVIMPKTVRFGSLSVPEADIEQIFIASGARKANQRRSQKQHRLTLDYVKGTQGIHDLLKIWHALEGPLHTGLARDWSDWNTSDGSMEPGDETLITAFDMPLRNTTDDSFVGDGTTTTFQAIKRYLVGATAAHTRTIKKLESGTVKAAVEGVEQTLGVDFVVDLTTGIFTFTTAPGDSVSPTAVPVTGGFAFYVPAFFVENQGFIQRLKTAKGSELQGLEMLEDLLA